MRYIINHACYQLADGRWIARFDLDQSEPSAIVSTECYDPRIDRTFATKEEAKSRNRQLALDSIDPNTELCECSDAEVGGESRPILIRRG